MSSVDRQAPFVMMTQTETIGLFKKVVNLLEMVVAHQATVVVAGTLNAKQGRHLQFALRTADELKQLFQDEITRQSGGPGDAQRTE